MCISVSIPPPDRAAKPSARIKEIVATNCPFADIDAKSFKNAKARVSEHIASLPIAPSVNTIFAKILWFATFNAPTRKPPREFFNFSAWSILPHWKYRRRKGCPGMCRPCNDTPRPTWLARTNNNPDALAHRQCGRAVFAPFPVDRTRNIQSVVARSENNFDHSI